MWYDKHRILAITNAVLNIPTILVVVGYLIKDHTCEMISKETEHMNDCKRAKLIAWIYCMVAWWIAPIIHFLIAVLCSNGIK